MKPRQRPKYNFIDHINKPFALLADPPRLLTMSTTPKIVFTPAPSLFLSAMTGNDPLHTWLRCSPARPHASLPVFLFYPHVSLAGGTPRQRPFIVHTDQSISTARIKEPFTSVTTLRALPLLQHGGPLNPLSSEVCSASPSWRAPSRVALRRGPQCDLSETLRNDVTDANPSSTGDVEHPRARDEAGDANTPLVHPRLDACHSRDGAHRTTANTIRGLQVSSRDTHACLGTPKGTHSLERMDLDPSPQIIPTHRSGVCCAQPTPPDTEETHLHATPHGTTNTTTTTPRLAALQTARDSDNPSPPEAARTRGAPAAGPSLPGDRYRSRGHTRRRRPREPAKATTTRNDQTH